MNKLMLSLNSFNNNKNNWKEKNSNFNKKKLILFLNRKRLSNKSQNFNKNNNLLKLNLQQK